MVLASSAAVYAPGPDPHREGGELGPTDVYGHTKLWAKQLAGLFGLRTGTSTPRSPGCSTSTDPGETNPHLIPTILRQAELGAELQLGNLSTRRSYLFVDDASEGLASLGARALGSPQLIANIGGSRDYDARELVDSVAALLGRELTVRTDESRLRRSDRPRLAADCSWAREQLGWEPRTSLETGLRAAARRPLATGVEVSSGHPMRIAIVAPLYRPAIGGVETHVEQLATRLAAAGEAVEVITQTSDRGLPWSETLDGVLVRRFGVIAHSDHYPFSPGLARFLRRQGAGYDLIHAHNYHALPALMATLVRGAPLVFTPHYHGRSDSAFRNALHRPYRLLGSRILDRCREGDRRRPGRGAATRRSLPGLGREDGGRAQRRRCRAHLGSHAVRARRLDRRALRRAPRHLQAPGPDDPRPRPPRAALRAADHRGRAGPDRAGGPRPRARPRAAGRVPGPGRGRSALPLVSHRGRLRDDIGDRGDAGDAAGGPLRGRQGGGERHPGPSRHGPLRRRAPQSGAALGRPPGPGGGDPRRGRERSPGGSIPTWGNVLDSTTAIYREALS